MKRHFGLWCAALGLCACGGEEPKPAAEDRCEIEGHSVFAERTLGEAITELPGASVEGLVSNQNITVKLPRVGGGPQLILKMRFSDATNLLDEITRASTQAFEIVDATDVPAGSMNVSGLDKYECPLSEGKICAQLGVDTDGDGLISDDDGEVYNASGGSIDFETIDGLTKSIKFHWSINLGTDIFDAMSASGQIRGCVDASYTSTGAATWTIE